MAEIGHLLLLPPPSVPGRNVLARVGAGRGTGADDSQNVATAVEETADATSDARGKQFRFRVLDGGRGDSLAGNAGVPARADPNAESTREQAAASGAQSVNGPPNNRRAGDSGAGSVPLGTARATFLAQLIAQEQLPQGLYNPPVRTADRAYRQAGGEPALTDGATSIARFRIAV